MLLVSCLSYKYFFFVQFSIAEIGNLVRPIVFFSRKTRVQGQQSDTLKIIAADAVFIRFVVHEVFIIAAVLRYCVFLFLFTFFPISFVRSPRFHSSLVVFINDLLLFARYFGRFFLVLLLLLFGWSYCGFWEKKERKKKVWVKSVRVSLEFISICHLVCARNQTIRQLIQSATNRKNINQKKTSEQKHLHRIHTIFGSIGFLFLHYLLVVVVSSRIVCVCVSWVSVSQMLQTVTNG